MNDYLDTLKHINLRPKKVKVEEGAELLMEEVSMSDIVLEQALVEQDTGKDELQNEIIKWFLENPYPEDDQVHKFAESKDIDPHKFEKQIYSILSAILSEGRSKGKDVNPDANELAMGIKVEMEHTTLPIVSRKIAMDHLKEIPDYYTRLDKMESEAGVKHH